MLLVYGCRPAVRPDCIIQQTTSGVAEGFGWAEAFCLHETYDGTVFVVEIPSVSLSDASIATKGNNLLPIFI